jgi:hypothetical protein
MALPEAAKASREYAINSMAELASESEERKKCAFLRLNEVGSKFD